MRIVRCRCGPRRSWATSWSRSRIDKLDLRAYLRRIGYDGPLAPTGETLTGLHRAHVAAIAFENLDIVLDRGVSVDLGAVQDKLVARGRGGYCYEHGLLFAAALDRVGYSVDRLLARIGAEEQRPRPRTHMALHVRAGGLGWLADVGFGAGLLEPLTWGNDEPCQQGSWTYQMKPSGPGHWQVRERLGTQWVVLYSFTGEPQHASDVTMANHFTATYPSSPFVGQLVVMRKDARARHLLRDRRLTIVRPGEPDQERQLADPEVLDVLRSTFGLSLTPAEAATVLASLGNGNGKPS
ncbi:MAG TPA: arylamine N-acetyltransferase [Pseudonocardiaceae bacterium]|nr:arylamine N-acetyltransferase [Pseudonocardiaceae bacterium]